MLSALQTDTVEEPLAVLLNKICLHRLLLRFCIITPIDLNLKINITGGCSLALCELKCSRIFRRQRERVSPIFRISCQRSKITRRQIFFTCPKILRTRPHFVTKVERIKLSRRVASLDTLGGLKIRNTACRKEECTMHNAQYQEQVSHCAF